MNNKNRRRNEDRRVGLEDIREEKLEQRRKTRRKTERQDTIVYYACYLFGFYLLIGWACLIVFLNKGQ